MFTLMDNYVTRFTRVATAQGRSHSIVSFAMKKERRRWLLRCWKSAIRAVVCRPFVGLRSTLLTNKAVDWERLKFDRYVSDSENVLCCENVRCCCGLYGRVGMR